MNLLKEHFDNLIVSVLILNNASALESETFKKQIAGEYEKGNNILILDMSLCLIIDYTFLATLLVLHRKYSSRGSKILFVSLQPKVRMLFERTGLLSVLEVFSSKQEAVRNIKGSYSQNDQ